MVNLLVVKSRVAFERYRSAAGGASGTLELPEADVAAPVGGSAGILIMASVRRVC